MRARIIGIGQSTAGDDGVGLEIVRSLERRVEADLIGGTKDARWQGLDLHQVPEPTHLVELLQTDVPVILIDALQAKLPPGHVLFLEAADLRETARSLSSHGVGVIQAIELARAIAPDRVSPSVQVVGVVIESAERGHLGLSPAVAAAIPVAVDMIGNLLYEGARRAN